MKLLHGPKLPTCANSHSSTFNTIVVQIRVKKRFMGQALLTVPCRIRQGCALVWSCDSVRLQRQIWSLIVVPFLDSQTRRSIFFSSHHADQGKVYGTPQP